MLATALIGVFATVVALIMTGGNLAAKTGNAKIWALLTALCFTATTGALTLMLFTQYGTVPGQTATMQKIQGSQDKVYNDQQTDAKLTGAKLADANHSLDASQASDIQEAKSNSEVNSSTRSAVNLQPAAAMNEVETGQFLVEVLQALKNGQPIPPKWSELLTNQHSN